MAASCNLLQLPFSKFSRFPSLPSSLHYASPAASLRRSPASFTAVTSLSVDPVTAVVNPVISHPNVLCFNSGYNVQILVDENEPEEAVLRRFRREVTKAGVIQECKRRRFFENKQEERKRKKREAGRRNRRRRSSGPRFSSSSSKVETSTADSKRASDDVDDNWDLPDGNLPY